MLIDSECVRSRCVIPVHRKVYIMDMYVLKLYVFGKVNSGSFGGCNRAPSRRCRNHFQQCQCRLTRGYSVNLMAGRDKLRTGQNTLVKNNSNA